MRKHSWTAGSGLPAVLTALLLLMPFPIAGPVPAWRSTFAWIALVPLLYSLLSESALIQPRYLLRSAFTGYLTGILWYGGNCYWVYQTMLHYGGMPAAGAFGILVLFSLYLGLYFATFSFLVAVLRKGLGKLWPALWMAPVLWVVVDLANASITSLPWDQLGYSQVDNFLLTRLAPYTGVYGITFVLTALNAALTGSLLAKSSKQRLRLGAGGLALTMLLQSGRLIVPPAAPVQDTAVLVQPNLSVDESNNWVGPVWDQKIHEYLQLSQKNCGTYIAGIPETHAPRLSLDCARDATALVVWPVSPSPFREDDPRFRTAASELTQTIRSAAIIGDTSIAENAPGSAQPIVMYDSASVFAADGNLVGRYDKIHLVPFGEYIPYRDLFFFAHSLTQQIGDTGRGRYRKVFRLNGHTYGILICYEAIFADEIRQLARMGAQVLVTISDDGWYGDTSAPWQILNMGRMRAIENRRWLLRDANSGVTSVIDPYGRVTQSIDRHVAGSLAARYGYRDETTFYTEHGDWFALLCAIIALVVTARAGKLIFQQYRLKLKPST